MTPNFGLLISRSHCIFTIHVESRSRVESSENVLQSKLNLVDLAGSERLSKTEAKGKSLKEATCISIDHDCFNKDRY